MTHPSDKELDEYLRRESPVSQRYRTLDADEVPPALDAAVMAQARAAIAKPAKPRQRMPAWVRWGSPLALAASAVMIVAIVLEVGVQDELRVPAPQVKQTPKAESGVAKNDTPPAASAEFESSQLKAEVEVERPVAALTPFAADPQLVNSPQAAAPPPAPQAPREARRERAQPAADANAPTPQFAARSGNIAPPPVQAAERRVAEEVIVTGANIRSVPEDSAMPVGVIAIEPSLKSNDQTRPPFGPRAPGAPRAVNADARGALAAEPQQYPTPQSWLDAIRKLRADGKTAEADEQWRMFRLAYPNFEVRAGDAALPQPQR